MHYETAQSLLFVLWFAMFVVFSLRVYKFFAGKKMFRSVR